MTEDVMLSRSGTTCPYGKCTEDIKAHVPEETKEALTALAFVQGITLSEYVRNVLHNHLYGHVATVRQAHTRKEVRE